MYCVSTKWCTPRRLLRGNVKQVPLSLNGLGWMYEYREERKQGVQLFHKATGAPVSSFPQYKTEGINEIHRERHEPEKCESEKTVNFVVIFFFRRYNYDVDSTTTLNGNQHYSLRRYYIEMVTWRKWSAWKEQRKVSEFCTADEPFWKAAPSFPLRPARNGCRRTNQPKIWTSYWNSESVNDRKNVLLVQKTMRKTFGNSYFHRHKLTGIDGGWLLGIFGIGVGGEEGGEERERVPSSLSPASTPRGNITN